MELPKVIRGEIECDCGAAARRVRGGGRASRRSELSPRLAQESVGGHKGSCAMARNARDEGAFVAFRRSARRGRGRHLRGIFPAGSV